MAKAAQAIFSYSMEDSELRRIAKSALRHASDRAAIGAGAMRSAVADKIKSAKTAAALPEDCSPISAKYERRVNDLRTVLIQEIEVEITNDAPTDAERKAVEDFFDWLFAEALSLQSRT
jgi:hypothetical protein